MNQINNLLPTSNKNDPFSICPDENLYDSLCLNDSNELSDDEMPFLSLLIQINERAKENINKISTHSTPRRSNFIVYTNDKKKKRGRQNKKNNKTPVHNSAQFDNLQRKIQVHFFTFVIDFCNEALKKEFKCFKKTFKNVNYKNKNTINYEYNFGLKKLCIKDILSMKISKKFKRYKKSYNKDLLESIENSSPWLDKLFQMNYLELFSYYFNNGNPLDKIMFENKEIKLSKKTQSFYYLLEKNKNLRKNLINTAEIVYFDGKDIDEYPFFIEKK